MQRKKFFQPALIKFCFVWMKHISRSCVCSKGLENTLGKLECTHESPGREYILIIAISSSSFLHLWKCSRLDRLGVAWSSTKCLCPWNKGSFEVSPNPNHSGILFHNPNRFFKGFIGTMSLHLQGKGTAGDGNHLDLGTCPTLNEAPWDVYPFTNAPKTRLSPTPPPSL